MVSRCKLCSGMAGRGGYVGVSCVAVSWAKVRYGTVRRSG